MAGAQRRHKVEAHPAPAFMTEINRHSFTFQCGLINWKTDQQRPLRGSVGLLQSVASRKIGDHSGPV